MKRMTWQNYDMCQFCGKDACCEHYCDNTFPVCDDKAIYDRLVTIEDILGDEYDLERLREMVQAKREGRVVVLPCKVGDTIYRIEYIELDGFKIGIGEHKFDCLFFALERKNFGKTVFFTREAAEEALKAREQK